MQNTKYKKVIVSDRLPTKNSNVILINCLGDTFNGYYSEKNNWIISTGGHFSSIEYWLEEVPDYEEEMKEMLDKAVQYLNECQWHPSYVETYSNFTMNANELLTKLKTES